MRSKLTIATRESKLALWQADYVAEVLRQRHPGLQVALLPMTTKGDQILDRPLSQIGGKGLFLKELEVAMLEGRADLAVHSLKDVPMTLDAEFQLAAIMQRHSPFDALVSSYQNIAALPVGAKVGSSSLRRQVQLRRLRPDLQLQDLRGNVLTRLRKLDDGQYDAIVLAHAGLDRLGFATRIAAVFDAETMLPAAGQGALAIECRSDDPDTAELLAPLADLETSICVRAERAFTLKLGGSCQVPIAAYAQLSDNQLRLRGMIGDAAAQHAMFDELTGSAQRPEQLGEALADRLLARGAEKFIVQRKNWS
jgi:hydroxymethylbilane synthase